MNDVKNVRPFIISRHESIFEWLEAKGIKGIKMAHVVPESLEAGDIVYGILPIAIIDRLVKKGVEVNLVILPALQKTMRGKELTPLEMDKAGAKIMRVTSLNLEELTTKSSKDWFKYWIDSNYA